MCRWIVDLRNYLSGADDVSLNVTINATVASKQGGEWLFIDAYTVTSTVTNATLPFLPHILSTLSPDSLKTSPVFLHIRGNYIVLTYSTASSSHQMSGIRIDWKIETESHDSDSTVTRAVSIIATVLIIAICCGCSALCLCRLCRQIKSHQIYQRTVLPDQTILRSFSRIDPMLINVSETYDISAIPKEVYDRKQTEGGETVCTVCLEK